MRGEYENGIYEWNMRIEYKNGMCGGRYENGIRELNIRMDYKGVVLKFGVKILI